MLEFLILVVLIAAIVVASRRWPDLERRFFGEGSLIPKRHTHEAGAKEEPAESVPEEPAQAASSAGGVMRTKPISTEPDVPQEESVPEPAAEETEPAEAPAEPAPTTPGERVTGTPARPSQPAYVDASRGGASTDSVEDLAAEADQAYRDRDYERAEAACLKILVKEPKNHKYMTRVGQVYQEMGQLEDAKEAFEAAKNLDPKNFFVLNRLAEVDRLLSDKGGRTSGTKSGK